MDYENDSIITAVVCPACEGVWAVVDALDRPNRIPHIVGVRRLLMETHTYLMRLLIIIRTYIKSEYYDTSIVIPHLHLCVLGRSGRNVTGGS